MAISTNPKPTRYRNMYQNTHPGDVVICLALHIFNKEMAAVEIHESTWDLQLCLTE